MIYNRHYILTDINNRVNNNMVNSCFLSFFINYINIIALITLYISFFIFIYLFENGLCCLSFKQYFDLIFSTNAICFISLYVHVS